MIHEGHLLLLLHEPPQHNHRTRQPRLFYRRPDGTWHSTADGSGLAALQKHLEQFDQLIEALDKREDEAHTADAYFELIEEILPLKRTAANLHATLDDARKQLPDVRELINYRDHAYDISRSADLLHEAITTGGDLAQTRRAEEHARHSESMSRSAHRLNLLVAFFFPLATMATVFGMNFDTDLDHLGSAPFYTICGLGLILGLALVFLFINRPAGSIAPRKKRE